jgi:thiol-disulfide isomerase/thioredoxin
MNRRPVLALAALALALTGCGAKPGLGSPQVNVDTPALRALKSSAGIKDCAQTTAAPAAHGLPDVTLPCLGGGPGVDLAGLRGPLVVNLFAQWCPPCRAELPVYQAFARKYAGRVGVLGIDWTDFQPASALRLAQQTGVTYPLVADPESKVRAPGNLLPQIVLIDRNGDVAWQQAVEIKSLGQLEKLVRDHLGVRT